MAESVCVGVRVRPFNDREKKLNASLCIDMVGPTTIIRDDSDKGTPFTFDESFWSHDGFVDDGTGYNEPAQGCNYADQRYVFETFGKRVLDNAWAGFHCCLFAYGQTGAGKSYSMVGYGKNKGIVPISCEEIFNRIDANDDDTKRYEVTVSMIEIYNEAVQDLLILPEDRPKKGLEIRESKLLGIYIDGVVKRPVKDYPEIEACIEEATNHRTVGSTLMNATSSRAHTVQIIEFKQCVMMGGKEQVKISMINLVDLAGSEKAGQTGASGDRLKEGAAINKSLSALGNVIEKLAEKSGGKGKNVIIPYRDSKLTRLLQNALGGSSKTIMICALSPASSNYEETLSTLRYADRAKKIKNTATVNENPQDRLLRELKEENAKLKEMMEQMQKGMVDTQALEAMAEKQQEIQDVEKELKEMQKTFEQRVAEAKEREYEQRERKRRTTLGLVTKGIAVPQLVNLNEDPQLTGRIKYSLEPGVITHIRGRKDEDEESGDSDTDSSDSSSHKDGLRDERDIMLLNDSVFHKHATIYNDESECFMLAEPKAANQTFVNGVSLEAMNRQNEAEEHPEAKLESVIKAAIEDSKEKSGDVESAVNVEATKEADSQEIAEPQENTEMQLKTGAQARLSLSRSSVCSVQGWSAYQSEEDSKQDGEDSKGKEGEKGKDDDSKSSDSDSSSSSSSDSDDSEAGREKKLKDRQMLKERHQTEGLRLKHGDRIVFGKCFFFYVVPGEGIAEVMITSGICDFHMASKELKRMRLKNAVFKIAGGGYAAGNSPSDFSSSISLPAMAMGSRMSAASLRDRAGTVASVTFSPQLVDDDDTASLRYKSPRGSLTFESICAAVDDIDDMSSQSESEMQETILNLRAQLAQSSAAISQQESVVRLQAEEIKELRAMLVQVGVPEVAQPPSKTAAPPQRDVQQSPHSLQLSPQPVLFETDAATGLSPRPGRPYRLTLPSALSPHHTVTDNKAKQLAAVKQDTGLSQHVADTFKSALGSLEKVELALMSLTNNGASKTYHKKKSVNIIQEVVEVEPEDEDVVEVGPEGFDV